MDWETLILNMLGTLIAWLGIGLCVLAMQGCGSDQSFKEWLEENIEPPKGIESAEDPENAEESCPTFFIEQWLGLPDTVEDEYDIRSICFFLAEDGESYAVADNGEDWSSSVPDWRCDGPNSLKFSAYGGKVNVYETSVSERYEVYADSWFGTYWAYVEPCDF